MNKEDVIREIYRAFKRLRLEDGVSLSEADVIDDYGTPQQRRDARKRDNHNEWQYVSTKQLQAHNGFAFMDAKGLRFYLPAYMLLALNSEDPSRGWNDSLFFSVQRDDALFQMLSDEQRAAVHAFLHYVADAVAPDDLIRKDAQKLIEKLGTPNPQKEPRRSGQ